MCCSPLSLLVNFYWHFVENDYGFSSGIKEFYLSIRYSLSPFLMIRKCKTHLLALILDFLHLHIYLMTGTLFDLFEANGISSYPSNTTWDKNGSILANGICSKAWFCIAIVMLYSCTIFICYFLITSSFGWIINFFLHHCLSTMVEDYRCSEDGM